MAKRKIDTTFIKEAIKRLREIEYALLMMPSTPFTNLEFKQLILTKKKIRKFRLKFENI